MKNIITELEAYFETEMHYLKVGLDNESDLIREVTWLGTAFSGAWVRLSSPIRWAAILASSNPCLSITKKKSKD